MLQRIIISNSKCLFLCTLLFTMMNVTFRVLFHDLENFVYTVYSPEFLDDETKIYDTPFSFRYPKLFKKKTWKLIRKPFTVQKIRNYTPSKRAWWCTTVLYGANFFNFLCDWKFEHLSKSECERVCVRACLHFKKSQRITIATAHYCNNYIYVIYYPFVGHAEPW